jgi:type VI secretion system protein ImpF
MSMERNTEQWHAAPPLLDRLTDSAPGVPDRLWISRAESVRLLKSSLRRDLEWLLNARRVAEAPAALRELNRSVFVYGLPDFSAYSLASSADRARLLADLESSVRLFEPRLDEVRVVPLEDERLSHAVRFRIEALLLVEPSPEQVSFDTVLELSSGAYQVKGDDDA